MTTTVRLLSYYDGNPFNTIVRLPDALAATFVAQGNATLDLTGGINRPVSLPKRADRGPAHLIYNDQGLFLGLGDGQNNLLLSASGATIPGGLTAPGAPTNLVLTALAGGISAAFSAPTNNGGDPDLRYELVLSNGTSVSGGSSPIAASAPAGTAVTAVLYAVNGVGTSAASNTSNSVTPTGVAPSIPATAITLTGPNTASVGTASGAYTVSLSPTGGTVASPVTVTPTPVTGVTFSPSSVQLSTASPTATFTANASTAGTKAIAVTSTGGLTAPAAINLVVSASVTVNAPTILGAVGFNNRAQVVVHAPTSGTAPTNFELTSSNGQVVTVASNGRDTQAIEIGSQPNGTPVTFTAKSVVGSTKSAASSASAAVTPVASRVSSVTANFFINDSQHPTNTQGFTVLTYRAMKTFSSLKLTYDNFRNVLRQETQSAGTLTVQASVRKGANKYRMTSAGQQSAVAAPTDAEAVFEKQALGFTVNAGEEFQIVSKGVSSGGTIMYFSWYGADGTARAKYGTNITETVDQDDLSTIPVSTSTPTTGAFIFGPSQILSDVDGACLGILIDSNGAGRGDTGDSAHAQGLFARAAALLNIPTVNVSTSGNRLYGNGSDGFLARSPKATARVLATCTHVIDEAGINDITAAGRTAAQVFADRAALNAKFPGLIVANTTLFPILQSSPASPLTPVSSQVPDPTFNPVVQEFNTLVRADTSTVWLGANEAVSADGDPTRFADGYTADGTHLAQAGAVGGATKLSAEFSKFVIA